MEDDIQNERPESPELSKPRFKVSPLVAAVIRVPRTIALIVGVIEIFRKAKR